MVTQQYIEPDLKWQIDNISCQREVSLETAPLTTESGFLLWQKDIPKDYWGLGGQELIDRIHAAKARLGERCVVLGHHYQREDIIQFADYTGDSFNLARWAAEQRAAECIVFCGVHFMAEAADILSAPNQQVILPNMSAGCTMADMADPDDVLDCWEQLNQAGLAAETTPVTYMNSTASLKAFCGHNGGIVCTSSNATAVLQWGFAQRQRVLFFPISISAATPALSSASLRTKCWCGTLISLWVGTPLRNSPEPASSSGAAGARSTCALAESRSRKRVPSIPA